jgi:DNA repair protein RecO (recombination protein O)
LRLSDRALVLRRFPYGESSLVVHLLTRQHGRVAALAKGAYRPRSRYCGVLDLFDTLEVEWRGGRGAGLALVAEAGIAVRRRALSRDLDRYRAALAVLELSGLGARERHEEARLFDLAERALDLLQDPGADPRVALVAFDLRFLQAMGLAPALEACAACGRAVPDPSDAAAPVPFSSGAGGRLCGSCAREARASGRSVAGIPLHVVREARSLMRAPARALVGVRVAPERMERVRALVQRFLDYHLETRPRSRGGRPDVPPRLPRARGAAPTFETPPA